MCGERDIEGWGWGHHRDGNGDTIKLGTGMCRGWRHSGHGDMGH